MAVARRRRRPAAVVDVPEETPEQISLPPETQEEREENEAMEKLERFQSMFHGKDYKVRVEKWNEEESEWEWTERFKLEGFDPLISLKKYGGGRFKLVLIDDGGKYIKGGHQLIRIAKPIVPEVPLVAPAPEPRSAFEDPAVKMMIEQSRSDRMGLMEMIKAIMAKPEPAKPDGMTPLQMIEMVKSVTGMMPKGEQTSIKDMLGIVGALKGLLEPKEGEADKGSVLSEILQAVEVGKKMGFIKAPNGAAPTPKPAISRDPAPVAAAPVNEIDPVVEKINRYIPMFEDWARTGEPVDDAASFLLARIENEFVPLLVKQYAGSGFEIDEDGIYERLVESAKNVGEVSSIFTKYPVLAPYEGWVRNVIASAVKTYEEQTSSAPPAEETPTPAIPEDLGVNEVPPTNG